MVFHRRRKPQPPARPMPMATTKPDNAPEPEKPFWLDHWFAHNNTWEMTVQLPLKDLCRPGSVVYDVGGNIGAMTSVMSRLVGPRGVVCTFEASPLVLKKLQRNVTLLGLNNVCLYDKAVYSSSLESLEFHLNGHPAGVHDSVFDLAARDGKQAEKVMVHTVALDDFHACTGLCPDLIKMDIEGCEPEALQGARALLAKARPHLIVELSSAFSKEANDEAFRQLLGDGYLAFDCASLRPMCPDDYARHPARLVNVLFIHQDRIGETPYAKLDPKPAGIFESASFQVDRLGARYRSPFRRLSSGRYRLTVDFLASGNQHLRAGLRTVNGATIFHYEDAAWRLAASYRDWLIDLPEEAEISVEFDFPEGAPDPGFVLRGVDITRFENFPCPLWARLAVD